MERTNQLTPFGPSDLSSEDPNASKAITATNDFWKLLKARKKVIKSPRMLVTQSVSEAK